MKKLETLFELPESKQIIATSKNKKTIEKETFDPLSSLGHLADIDKISASLPRVTGLGDKADHELDELAKRATEAYDDLMDLGMNVESRYSGRIFEVASSMLKNAIDAKTAKIDKKLKIIELQLKKQKLDMDIEPDSTTVDANISGNGFVVADRNSLIEQLKQLKKES
jgi:hypothetical protein